MKTPRHRVIQVSDSVGVHILNLDEGDWTRGTGSCAPTRNILHVVTMRKVSVPAKNRTPEYPVYSLTSVFTEI
jgi:hypothetical protein